MSKNKKANGVGRPGSTGPRGAKQANAAPKRAPKRRNPDDEPQSLKEMDGTQKLIGIVLTLAAAIIPLIVRYIVRPFGPDQQAFITTSEDSPDMFSYYKSILVLWASAAIFVAASVSTLTSRKPLDAKKLLTPMNIAAAAHILLAVASSIFSKYHYTVLNGIGERYESIFVVLSYFVLFFAAASFSRVEGAARLLIHGVMFSCIVIGVIGAFQFFGLDFFMTDLGRRLVVGWASNVGLTSQFTGLKMSYTTLYNPNAVGLYCALMFPLCAISAVCARKRPLMRVMFAIGAAVMFITAMGCNSTGGIVGQGAAALALAAVGAAAVAMGGRKRSVAVNGGG
jgi:hypothetical protein